MTKGMMTAEYTKLKTTCILTPVISAVVLLLFTCLEWYLYFRQGETGIYSGLNIVYMFLSFTLLLTITLICSILAETEHQAQGLKLIFSMPVSRFGFYIRKAVLAGILMLLCCFLILMGFTGIWQFSTEEPFPFLFLAKQIFGGLFASFPLLSLQLYLSFRFSNQTFPMTIGCIGAVSSLFLVRNGGLILYFLPWAYPSMASPFMEGYRVFIMLGIAVGLLFLVTGAFLFSKTEIK
jgi:hypothetical protein